MKIPNFFTLNDIGIKKFIIVISVFLVVILGLSELENLGIKIPLVREITALLFLSFFPGLIILRIFRQHQLGYY